MIRSWRFWVACLGTVHFAVSSFLWIAFSVFTIYLAKKTTGGVTGDGVVYIAKRLAPCLILLAGFMSAVRAERRESPLRKAILLSCAVCSFLLFAHDVYTHDYQIQDMTDNGCRHTYVTWFWMNDWWSPWR